MYDNNDIRTLCWDTWVSFATTKALMIVTGIVIVIVNFILQLAIDKLGKYNRYNTVTKFSMSNTTKLFLAIFINTAIITLVLQASIYGFKPAVTFSSPIPALK